MFSISTCVIEEAKKGKIAEHPITANNFHFPLLLSDDK